jgi:hypothetical protein
VTSFDVLYGLPDDVERAAAREMARVVRPGGHVLITVAALECCAAGTGRSRRSCGATTRHAARAARRRRSGDRPHLYTFALLFPLLYSVRAFQRWQGADRRAERHRISVPAARERGASASSSSSRGCWRDGRRSGVRSSALPAGARDAAGRPRPPCPER